MIRASVIGATGYAGEELVRLLASHPQVEIAHLASRSGEGQQIEDLYPSLRGNVRRTLDPVDPALIAKDSDVVFTALPHAAAADAVSELLALGTKVVDLSADFRYNDAQVYSQWYAVEHKYPDLLAEAVYGLPELYRKEIAGKRLIANPGCYTTSAILPLAPLLKEKLILPKGIIIDAKSGVSGAGVKPSATVHFCEVDSSLKAYSVAKHRHTSEIEQELSIKAGQEVVLSFTPHLLPIKRGILSTIYAELAQGVTANDITLAYETAYANEPFISLYPENSLPEIKHVSGSNRCGIGFVVDKRLNRLVIVSCLDNLIKGAAGQAIQNMNIIMDIDETCGLNTPAWYL